MPSTAPAPRKGPLSRPHVPVPLWVIGLTGWVLALRRVVAELLG